MSGLFFFFLREQSLLMRGIKCKRSLSSSVADLKFSLTESPIGSLGLLKLWSLGFSGHLMALELEILFWKYISCNNKGLWWDSVNNRVNTFGVVQLWRFHFIRKKSYPKHESEPERPALMVIYRAWCWIVECICFGFPWRYSELNYLNAKIVIWSFLVKVQCLVVFYIF